MTWTEEERARSRAIYARRKERDPEGLSLRLRRMNLAKYGLTIEMFEDMKAAQEGKCGICHEAPARLDIDHDHDCCDGKAVSCGECIRGLLCLRCNTKFDWFLEFEEEVNAWRNRRYVKPAAE